MSKQDIAQYNIPDGDVAVIKGYINFGNVGVFGTIPNSRFNTKSWNLSLYDPEVVKASDNFKNYIVNELFVDGTGNNVGHKVIYAKSSNENMPPMIFDAKSKSSVGKPANEVLTDANGTVHSIASGTPVQISLRKFTTTKYGTRSSVALNAILVEDINNIPYYNGGNTIEQFGIKPATSASPFKDDQAETNVTSDNDTSAFASADESSSDTDTTPTNDAPVDDPFAGSTTVDADDNPFK